MSEIGQIRVGTSGWRYPPWRGAFYPAGLPQRRELEYLSRQTNAVEINGSFYSLQRPERYRGWHAETPPEFLFAVKGGRFITHLKQLRDVETALANFFASGVLALADKLGPFLWQLPPRLAFDPDRVATFLGQLPRTTSEAATLGAKHDDKLKSEAFLEPGPDRPVRHALEVRHESFTTPEALALLKNHRVALVTSDAAAPGRTGRTRPLTSATSGCTARMSSTPAITPTQPCATGPRRSPNGTTAVAETCTSTSTTTAKSRPRTTPSRSPACWASPPKPTRDSERTVSALRLGSDTGRRWSTCCRWGSARGPPRPAVLRRPTGGTFRRTAEPIFASAVLAPDSLRQQLDPCPASNLGHADMAEISLYLAGSKWSNQSRAAAVPARTFLASRRLRSHRSAAEWSSPAATGPHTGHRAPIRTRMSQPH